MNKTNDDKTSQKISDMQQESTSDNEESDSVTDQSSSTASENVTKSKDGKKYAQNSLVSSSSSSSAATKVATQFSVQSSDVDGLRMKISAIRPNTTNYNNIKNNNNNNNSININNLTTGDRINNNLNTVELLKLKINSKLRQQESIHQQTKSRLLEPASTSTTTGSQTIATTTMPIETIANHHSNHIAPVASATSLIAISNKSPEITKEMLATQNVSITSNSNANEQSLPLSPKHRLSCFSDNDSVSACSEATTTTITASNDKTVKRVKVKRKKAQTKSSNSKKIYKKSRSHRSFSSDSDDDDVVGSAIQHHQQRAPRILLTAINAKSSIGSPQLKPLRSVVLSSSTVATHQANGSDNIGLSSSDNELPDLVSAAIKRVESDVDDTGFRKAKTKNLPQYQSTLLQDFMEKTQKLGQPSSTTHSAGHDARPKPVLRTDLFANLNSNSQSDSVASGSEVSKKRRGRPKKGSSQLEAAAARATLLSVTTAVATAVTVSNINESADSGVISTTSTTQSKSPSPKLPPSVSLIAMIGEAQKSFATRRTELDEPNSISCKNSQTDSISLSTLASTNLKPKIDMAYLDKRMYATERVLYPPPRNKRRRQSMSALTVQTRSAQVDKKTVNLSTKPTKEELQLDPVWRKIDVNKKFRRPSVSGYKSDSGGLNGHNVTVCSKILAAKSGYVSDYGSVHLRSHHHHHHNSGYKSDASCKSRYSTKSCSSRRRSSRAKSCGYRSDGKESTKSSRYRRRRQSSIFKGAKTKPTQNINDQDILQLAGLSLGQSSEDSNEYVCKPNLESLPTTSVSKKYGEINRFIATGEYFGRGSSGNSSFNHQLVTKDSLYDAATDDVSQDCFSTFNGKFILPQKSTQVSDILPGIIVQTSRRIKSRRSSAASMCSSSYYSSTSKVRRRRRHRCSRLLSMGKSTTTDSKILIEIEIMTNIFDSMCRIQNNEKPHSTTSDKDKLLGDAKYQGLPGSTSGTVGAIGIAGTAGSTAATVTGSTSKREGRDKRAQKKRKGTENHEYVSAGSLVTSTSGSTKRRHKKANSSSPDDHKLPLKKRHYLLTPGEKSTEAAVAVAAKLFAQNRDAWAAAAAAVASKSVPKQVQQSGTKSAKCGGPLTPKKRHLLQNATHIEDSGSIKGSNSSPLRIAIDTATSVSGGKLLDISPMSMSSSTKVNETVNKKRSRLEGVLSKISNHTDDTSKDSTLKAVSKSSMVSAPQLDSETSCPPPGVFEPSIELEIQIPPITKLTEAAVSIITKSEVESPLLADLSKPFASVATKQESARVVETLLNKTGGNLVLKRKRKKINRTGFPTVRRKKRKVNENLLLDVTPDISMEIEKTTPKRVPSVVLSTKATKQTAQASSEGVSDGTDRVIRTPRLSVVALERLQNTPTPSSTASSSSSTVAGSPTCKAQPMARTTREKTREPAKSKRRNQKLSEQNIPKEEHTFVPNNKSKLRRTEASLRKHKSNTENVHMTTSEAEEEIAKAKDHGNSSPVEGRRIRKTTLATGKSENATLSKSSIHKIITAKSLETKVKLPAGLDPNTNFSCKIRLPRRTNLYSMMLSHSKGKETPEVDEPKQDEDAIRKPEEIDAEALAKDCNVDEPEHDILPNSELLFPDSDDASDASEATPPTVSPKQRYKCTALVAGLFSDYYKVDHPVSSESGKSQSASVSVSGKKSANDKYELPAEIWKRLHEKDPDDRNSIILPPPPYCERYFRRREIDFKLPYSIWAGYVIKKPTTTMEPISLDSWKYRRIRTNIYADNVRPNLAGFENPVCNCKPESGCGDNCLNRMVYTECSPTNCPTGVKCRNQSIQRHKNAPGIKRFMTENKGWGVRTKLPIEKGTYILEYVGEVVAERDFKDRMGTIYRDDIHHYCLHLNSGLVIDGHRMGNDGRFVNHSCEPNCEMQKWSVNGLYRMALFAKYDIKPGEELTYDYNFALFNPSEGQKCLCNATNCRGVIGGKSQRVKPEVKQTDASPKDLNSCRQRKRKARKNMQRLQSKEVAVAQVQQLSERERKLVMLYNIFLVRNFEKVRQRRARLDLCNACPSSLNPNNNNRRPSTPSPLAVHISALCSSRSIKTRGLTMAVQDPEVEKMAKMAVIFRDICTALEALKDPNDEKCLLVSLVTAVGNKKKRAVKTNQKLEAIDIKTVLSNIEQGYYKQPSEFDQDMQKLFVEARQTNCGDDAKLRALDALVGAYETKKTESYEHLLELVNDKTALEGFQPKIDLKETASEPAAKTTPETVIESEPKAESELEIASATTVETSSEVQTPADVPDHEPALASISATTSIDAKEETAVGESTSPAPMLSPKTTASPVVSPPPAPPQTPTPTTAVVQRKSGASTKRNSRHLNEDIIRCICGLYKDEGIMIQCTSCMVWQHADCTKADVAANTYHCDLCEPREIDREIPLNEYTDEGHRYYISLMRGTLQVRQGDAVYVLRDIPIRDDEGKIVPSKKHTYETIGNIDYNQCDIFRVERLWKNDQGKRFIFGHHFLRPHETFHEPTRRFYPNEVVRVPLYEVVPIELVIGRCWVLDRTTFCKGRPIECSEEEHCYICELRVDKSARFFSKAKINYPTCTKSYAFRNFPEKLKISKTYAPHELDQSLLKPKKQKTAKEVAISSTATPVGAAAATTNGSVVAPATPNGNASATAAPQSEQSKLQQSGTRRRRNATLNSPTLRAQTSSPITVQTIKEKRSHLESVLKAIKHVKNAQANDDKSYDLSSLLTGRGARKRKGLAAATAAITSTIISGS